MRGVQIQLAGSDPVSVEAAAEEMKVRFGARFHVTHRSRRKDGSLILRGVILADAANPLDASAADLLSRQTGCPGA